MKRSYLKRIFITLFLTINLFASAQTDIFEIVQNGSLEDLQKAINLGIDVNIKDSDNATPLMIAVAGEHSEFIKPLLDAGADAEARDINGWTALTHAQRHSADEAIIQMLRNAAPKAAAQMDFFKLLEQGSLAEVKAAFNADIDLTAYDEYGDTTLIRASYSNPNPEVIQFLLDKGLEVNQTNKLIGTQIMRTIDALSGFTPLIAAARSNTNPEVLKVLIEAGANLNDDQQDGPPLMQALEFNENPEVAYTLIRYDADVNIQNDYGNFPLMMAVSSNDLELAKALLEG